MHRTRYSCGFTALFLTMGVVVIADQGRGGAKPQHPTTSPHATTTMKPAAAMQPKGMKPATSPKTMKPVSTQKPMKAASAPKTTKTSTGSTMKSAKTTKTEPVKLAKTEKPSKTTDTTTKATTAAPTTTPGTTTTVVLTPVQEKLQKNTNLASKLASRLPAGTDLMKAADGFRNLGQFVAAVNVSYNLGFSFDDLKTSMVTDGKSLGQSIQALKPVASSTIEAQRAEFDARVLIAESEQQPQVTTTATSTTTSKSKTKTKKPGQ
jgi:hypothetical protein